MDRQTYEQIDRMEAKIDLILKRVAPELFKEGDKDE